MLSRRELATVLAALRHWQRLLATDDPPPSAYAVLFEDAEPLGVEEIDALCERLNGAPVASDESALCDCHRPGFFCSGVPGILAHLDGGKLAPDASVERCDVCERFPSDEAARARLRDLGIA